MNAKDIENKVKALYENVEPGWETKRDTYLISAAMHSDRLKEKYKDPDYKERWLESQRNKPAEINQASGERLIKINKERFANIQYVFRTPGSDLLDFYDEMHEKRQAKKCHVKPSVIYQIRFKEQYTKGHMNARVREVLSEHLDLSKESECFVGDMRKKAMLWLTPEKSKQFIFNSRHALIEFLEKEYDSKSSIPVTPFADEPVFEHMWWHSKLVGCSLIAVIT